MTVDQLRKIIKNVPGHLKVEITVSYDEWNAAVVTADRHHLRICKDDSEMSRGETVLWPETENERDDGCTCRAGSVNSASIDPPDRVTNRHCPVHGILAARDPDAAYESQRDDGRDA